MTRTCHILLVLSAISATAHGQGVVLPTAGPINGSMAGASVAAPLDPAGALYWNAATIMGLSGSEVAFGSDFSHPETRVASSLPAGAFGPAVPPVPLSGRSRSSSGVATLPNLAFVHHSDRLPYAVGLGIFAIGGFSTNYAGSATNPIFQPPAPAGFGFGPVSTRLSMLQFVPTIAGQLTDRLSIGISPTVTVADLLLDPGIFAAPNITGEYPSVTGARPHWGLGLQGGLYYTLDNGFRLGASVKSPVWFETFEFDARDGVGNRRDVQLNLDYPMVVSVGASYAAGDCLVTAIDLRYIDYDNADGLGDTAGFAPTGAVTGLGWDGVFALATGLQYQVTESTSVRLGYLVNESPIPDAAAAFNVGSPNFLQHMITFGMSHQLTPAIKASISYLHLFHNSISGPYTTALTGPIAGSSVDVSTSNNVLAVGLNINY